MAIRLSELSADSVSKLQKGWERSVAPCVDASAAVIATTPVRGVAVLRDLISLNRSFIDALVSTARSDLSPFGQLREMSSNAVDRLSDCPFALFSLQMFGNRPLEMGRRFAPEDCAMGLVSGVAAYFAWHLVRVEISSARGYLGLDATTAARLQAMSLGRLHAEVAGAGVGVEARWADNQLFWRRLIAAAKEDDAMLAREAHALGRQLLAAEALERIPSVVVRRHVGPEPGRAMARAVVSPTLCSIS